jgi:hypothetical protein
MKPLAIGIVSVGLLWGTPVLAKTTCADLLANNSYDCDFISQQEHSRTACLKFTSPGPANEIDVLYATGQFVLTGGCSCGATGTVTRHQFDVSQTFDCIVTDGVGSEIIAGKVTSKKVAGHATGPSGYSDIFACRKSSTTCR